MSFLPRAPLGTAAPYRHMPYEAISEADYAAAAARLRPLRLQEAPGGDSVSAFPAGPDQFCDSSGCDVDGVSAAQRRTSPPH